MPEAEQERFRTKMQGFIGQEATHQRVHGLFNAHLARQGLEKWGPRALQRRDMLQGVDVRHSVAITAANEHFTAILADWTLRNADVLEGADPRLQALWLWHSAEESEHKSTAFDLYKALDATSSGG